MRSPRVLIAAALAVMALAVVACGPQEDGPDLSRFAAVSPAVPQAAGR